MMLTASPRGLSTADPNSDKPQLSVKRYRQCILSVVNSTLHLQTYQCAILSTVQKNCWHSCFFFFKKKIASSNFYSSLSPQFSTLVKISQIWTEHNIVPYRLQRATLVWLPTYPLPRGSSQFVVHSNELHRAQATRRIWSNSLQCANFTLGTSL